MTDVEASGAEVSAPLPISQIRVVGDWIFLAGQGALNERNEIVGNTIEEQTDQSLKNIDSLLNQAGCSLADVVSVLVHLSDLANADGYNRVYAQHFPDPKPVRTTVEARLLMGLLVEITVIARRPGAQI